MVQRDRKEAHPELASSPTPLAIGGNLFGGVTFVSNHCPGCSKVIGLDGNCECRRCPKCRSLLVNGVCYGCHNM